MATVADTVQFLHKVPLLQGLKQHHLELLAKRCVEREYLAGQAIVTQGLGGEGFFIIVSGQAQAIRERSDGAKIVVNSFGPTDFFGELALLDDGLRTATVVTQETTKCLVLTRWDFLGTLRDDAEMAVIVLQELARRFRVALDSL